MTSRWCHADVMDITPYVDRLRADLAQTAAAGDEQVRTAAERLALALDPAMRLTLMEVLSEASAEITAGMRNGGSLGGTSTRTSADAPNGRRLHCIESPI